MCPLNRGGPYCRFFSTVELNVTFYRLPLPKTFDGWYNETPQDFVFSLKGSRFITHIKRLLTPAEAVDLFFVRSLHLREKLKVVLWQFPPGFKRDIKRLKDFLKLLKRYPVKNTLEFRHESWITDTVFQLCGEYDASLCMADWPRFIDELPVTSDFVYIRRHGACGGYATCYPKAALKADAKRIKRYLKCKTDVFMYYNNDAYGYAPKNALELSDMLK